MNNNVKEVIIQNTSEEHHAKPSSRTDPKIKERLHVISQMLIEKNKDAYRRLANV